MAVRADARFDSLDGKFQQVITALLNTHSSLASDVQIQTRAIAQMLSRMEIAVMSQQDQTQAIIIDTLRKYSDLGPSKMSPKEKWTDKIAKDFEEEEKDLKFRVERMLLQSLVFLTMRDRIEEVPEEHMNTFRWLFDRTQTISWNHFGDWLREPGGLYWVNGKAASGKSTLMRFIYRNPKTFELLSRWASPRELETAAFFFWNSGTPEQRSLSGFLKALLYEVLDRRRDLIPVLLPRHWAKTYVEFLRSPDHNADIT
jgi:hypothetical protein